MIGNIKEILPPKTGLREKQVLQDPGYVKGVETTYCMLHGMLQGCTKYRYQLNLLRIGGTSN